jgi:IS30 family transposase
MVKLFPPNTRTEFLDLVCAGMSVLRAARRVGASGPTGTRWWAQSGQMTVSMGPSGGLPDPAPTPEGPGGRALNLAERGMIQMGRRSGLSYAKIGEAIGRNKSVVWREVNRNTSQDGVYYASVAHTRAHQARHRPKPLKLVEEEALCRLIGVWMDDGWSPKLISSMLAFYFADDQTMQVSHETIYQALYVQTRGSLRADLAEKLSLKRKQRVPHTADRQKNSPCKEAFKISERPAEAEDRAVPGHWESQCCCQAAWTRLTVPGSR